MNCEEARETVLDSLAGLIPAELQPMLESHISTCEVCHRFAEVQRALDARLTAAVPVMSLSAGFRSSLRGKLRDHAIVGWPESLPDIAHLMGCALAVALSILVLPQYSRIVVLAGSAFTAVTYFLQAVLRSSLDTLEDSL